MAAETKDDFPAVLGPFRRINARPGDDPGLAVEEVAGWERGLILREEGVTFAGQYGSWQQNGYWLYPAGEVGAPQAAASMWADFDARPGPSAPALHEVVFGDRAQRFKLDIDAKWGDVRACGLAPSRIRQTILDVFLDEFAASHGNEGAFLSEGDVSVYDASVRGTKLSLHLVTVPVAAPNAEAPRALAFAVRGALAADPTTAALAAFVDCQTFAKGAQGFRLPGAAKLTAPDRVLRCVGGAERTLVGWFGPEVKLVGHRAARLAPESCAPADHDLPDEDVRRALDVCRDLWQGGFAFRGVSGSLLSFNRSRPAPCHLCATPDGRPEIHHRDNTLMLQVLPEAEACKDAGSRGRRVLALCRHAPGRNLVAGCFESDAPWLGRYTPSDEAAAEKGRAGVGGDEFNARYLVAAVEKAARSVARWERRGPAESVDDLLDGCFEEAQRYYDAHEGPGARTPLHNIVALAESNCRVATGPSKTFADPVWEVVGPFLPDLRLETYTEPEMRPLPPGSDLFVVGGMGTGKTKRLIEYVGRHFPVRPVGGATVLFVTFRRSLARWASSRLGGLGFALYSDVTGGLSPESHPRLVVQVESLSRLEIRGAPPPDLLILDESESVIAQLGSGLAKNQRRTLAVFDWLLRFSGRVVCLDAHLGARTAHVVGALRWGEAAPDVFRSHGVHSAPLLIHNRTRPGVHETYRLTTSHPLWLKSLLEAVDAGRRVVVPTNSLAEAESLHLILTQRYAPGRISSDGGSAPNPRDSSAPNPRDGSAPNPRDSRAPPKIVMYTSRTSSEVRSRDFADVGRAWLDVDVLIYTPTVSAGVSFEERECFDEVFALFTSSSCDALAAVQMLGRVRSLNRATYTICIQGRPPSPLLPVDEAGLVDAIDRRQSALVGDARLQTPAYRLGADGTPALIRTPFVTVWLANMEVVNASRNDYAGILSLLLAARGGSFTLLESGADESEIRAMRALSRVARAGAALGEAQAVVEATEITVDQADRLRLAVRRRAGEMTGQVRLALAKHHLRCLYRIAIVGLEPDWVVAYSSPDISRLYRDVRTLVPRLSDVDAALAANERALARTLVASGGETTGSAWGSALVERAASGSGARALRFALYFWAARALGLQVCGPDGVFAHLTRRRPSAAVIPPRELGCALVLAGPTARWAESSVAEAELDARVTAPPASVTSLLGHIPPEVLRALTVARHVLSAGLGVSIRAVEGGLALRLSQKGNRFRYVAGRVPLGTFPADEKLRPFIVVGSDT